MTTILIDKTYRSHRHAMKKLKNINFKGYGHGHRSRKSIDKEKMFYSSLKKALKYKLILENKYDCELFIYPVTIKTHYQIKGGTQHRPNTDCISTYGYFLTTKRKKNYFNLTDS